jgi:hypothetical protein
VIVLFWLFTAPFYWVVLKKPQYAVAGVITVITTTLIVAYQLEQRQIGIAAIEKSGQTYLPIITFGPVRLATVLAGLGCAFIWTIFPYPITEHSILRTTMAGGLFILAQYYSVVHETISVRIRQVEGDDSQKDTPGYVLQKHRNQMFSKLVLSIQNLKIYREYIDWEIPIGGRFPTKQYDTIIDCIEQ